MSPESRPAPPCAIEECGEPADVTVRVTTDPSLLDGPGTALCADHAGALMRGTTRAGVVTYVMVVPLGGKS